mmetsp:Transcript_7479/g.12685  ORF Transcript_7479/g.12685 Transcript_7479/m.12685 type:complete len:375 (+) Transcript_7479:59-1183(+)|eukprot:CAMPEP_0119311656 /NCGR_PEP_ID=MMETSP1333-20130426/23253_1 /TAXON_ID=418940 /ORGANISM="Scyphosphaera apsteinii, Strain RCC1455" /LENGTH=374 /DNA_ID=CAMNT_0007316089 /DNA_START=56 /DNA_END=1180 /DNA_ORIENTATION=+
MFEREGLVADIDPGASCMAAHAAGWAKYPKMPLETAGKGSDGPLCGTWIVTEKVHGANFSVVCEETRGVTTVSFAKRSGILADSEDFFSFRSSRLQVRLEQSARALLHVARRNLPEITSVVVYGELAGGRYPHSDVPAAGLHPVQNGVWYAPQLFFMAFDLVLCTAATDRRFADFDEASAWCTEAGFLFAAPLMRGSLSACLDAPVRFKSTLAARLGLPPLSTANLAEGVVVRPAREPRSSTARSLFKRKIAEFSETQYQNEDWRTGAAGGLGEARGALSQMELLRIEMAARVTAQRMDNAISKLGHIDPTQREARRTLLQELKTDVVASLVEDGVTPSAHAFANSGLNQELDAAARELLTPYLRKQVAARAAG